MKTEKLPHQFGTADIASPELKKVAMMIMEDIKFLHRQLASVQAAIREMKKGG